MFETYRMLGEQRELDLLREVERLHAGHAANEGGVPHVTGSRLGSVLRRMSRTWRLERKGRAMDVSGRGIGVLLTLVVAAAAIGASGAQAGSTPEPDADATAIHWKHEDALYGSTPSTTPSTTQPQTTAAQLRALHWKHEDALYGAAVSTSGSERPAAVESVGAGDGFGWAGVGSAGAAVALIVLGGAATVLIRRRHTPFAQS